MLKKASLQIWILGIALLFNNWSKSQDSVYIKEYDWNVLYISFGKGDMMLCEDKSIVTIAPNHSSVSTRKNYKLIKLDPDANFLWATELINTWAHAGVSEDDDGNLLIATVDTLSHAVIIKTNQSGMVLWSKICPVVSLSRDVITIDDYHYLIGSAEAGSSGNDYYYVTKFDLNGNVIWSRHYTVNYPILLTKSIKTSDNEILVAGNFIEGSIDYEYFMHTFKLDTSGAVLWSKKHAVSEYQYVYDITESPNGDFAFTGAVYDPDPDIFYFLTDASGNYKNSCTYHKNSHQEAFGIYPTAEGGYMICAEPEAFFDRTVPQIAMMRIDEKGLIEEMVVHDISSSGAFPVGFAKDEHGYFISGIRLDSFKLMTLRTNLNGEIFCNEIYETLDQTVTTSVTSDKSMSPFDGPVFENHNVVQYFYSVSDTTICINQLNPGEIVHYLPEVPNVFSPDGDGINDLFFIDYPYSTGFMFAVIDRWGRTVFQSTDPANGWNGVVQNSGKPATAGVYYYILTVGELSKYGAITLIR